MRKELIEKLSAIKTPFYYYDLELLKQTMLKAKTEADKYQYLVHYVLKANCDTQVLAMVREHDYRADCVSGNEVKCALDNGFANTQVVFAGVGKTDDEINIAAYKPHQNMI